MNRLKRLHKWLYTYAPYIFSALCIILFILMVVMLILCAGKAILTSLGVI